MELVIKYKPTIEKQLLTPLAYKIVQWIALCEFLIVLILPWFKLMDLSAGTLSFLLGAILALIVCVILFLYIIWASGNMYFEK